MDTESHKARMEEIQKRKAERRKKQIFKNRCIAAVFCLLVIVLVVFGIRSCVKGIAANKAEKNAQVSMSPSPSPTPIATDKSGIDQTYFEDSAFLGNSFIEGMVIYDLVDGADYFGKVGLNVKTAFTDSTENGTVPVIEELNSTKVYKKVFLMFGENELGWSNTQTFVDEYTRIVKKAKQYQPEATIYLLSVTPITEEVSNVGTDGETNENIIKINKLIKQIASDQKVVYCNIYNACADENGVLPKGAATDGIHFGNDYYKKCLIYIQKNYDDETVDSITSSSGKSSSSSSSSGSSSSGSSSSNSGSSSSGSSSGSSSSSSGKSSSGGSSSSSGKSSSSSGNSSSSSGSSSSGSSSSSGNSSGSSSTKAPAKSLD